MCGCVLVQPLISFDSPSPCNSVSWCSLSQSELRRFGLGPRRQDALVATCAVLDNWVCLKIENPPPSHWVAFGFPSKRVPSKNETLGGLCKRLLPGYWTFLELPSFRLFICLLFTGPKTCHRLGPVNCQPSQSHRVWCPFRRKRI